MDNSKLVLAFRVLAATVLIAVASTLAELFFVLAMKSLHPTFRFTGSYAIVIFSALCGVLPSWPAPSKICELPLGLAQRVLVAAEVTTIVLLAIATFVVAHGARVHDFASASALTYAVVLVTSAVWYRRNH